MSNHNQCIQDELERTKKCMEDVEHLYVIYKGKNLPVDDQLIEQFGVKPGDIIDDELFKLMYRQVELDFANGVRSLLGKENPDTSRIII